jgi:hypothetical protein
VNNPANVTTVAIAGRTTRSVGKADAKPGKGSMVLALNRLRVGRYTLLVSATNAAGKSARARVRVKVTWKLRYRALSAQKAAAKAAPEATASVPVVGAAATATAAPSARPAAAATSTATPAPAPPVCDRAATDHSGHGHGSADPRCDTSGSSGGSSHGG